MKKLVIMFIAVAAISIASCGNKTNQGTAIDTDTIVNPEFYENNSTYTNDITQNDSTKFTNDSVNVKK